jgi:small subunit ribosomal protein S13
MVKTKTRLIMARIAGVDIRKQKRGVISLTYIFGIGRTRAKEILKAAGVDDSVKVNDWSDSDISKIREAVSTFTIEGELRSETQLNIKRLMDIGCYRGIRHRSGLPLRGQRTKNNSRTRKGRRKTVANKKKVTK